MSKGIATLPQAASASIGADPINAFHPIRPASNSRRRMASFLVVGVPAAILVAAVALSQLTPAFYAQRASSPESQQSLPLSNQFLNTVSRLIGDMQNGRNWEANFTEDQINAWLAHDFQQNHAAKSLPAGVTKPRVEVTGDQLQVGFRWRRGPLSSILQITVRAWVPKQNLLCVELESVRAGWLPLPTTYTRKVIEEFVQAQNLDIVWKRSGRRLVALIDFERGKRQVVLRQVEIKRDSLGIEGLGGRAIPGADYAPTAN